MSEGVDYSWARPGGAALKAAGKQFAVRYLYPDGQGGKGLDASEIADLRAHGIAVAVVYESSANRALAGRAAGAADARTAQAQLVAVGLPADLPIYFGVDFDATAAQQGPIDEYLRGVASVIGLSRVGVYAGIGPVQRCQANGTATWFWQTYAWSGGRVAAGIHLYQYRNGQSINGGAVDFCRSLADNFGQSGAAGPASAPSAGPSADLRRVQTRLIQLGYDLGPTGVDGIGGRFTRAAVVAFQQANGLETDGIAGPLTKAKLFPSAVKPAVKPAGVKPAAKLTVDGIRGTLTIKAEQRALGVEPDGVFGPISIGAEQRRVGVRVDRIRGPLTIKGVQRHVGLRGRQVDGIEGPITIKAEQRALNAGKF